MAYVWVSLFRDCRPGCIYMCLKHNPDGARAGKGVGERTPPVSLDSFT